MAHLRQHYPTVPAILISGSMTDEIEHQARAGGAFSIIRKPFDLNTLKGRRRRRDPERLGWLTITASAPSASPSASSRSADEPELTMLHRWLDCWRGVGDVAVGMHRQGWDLQLTEYGNGHWRATFYVTGMAHSIVGGSADEPTPWRAVQRAGWAAVTREVQ